jgi:hypothetical protein
MGMANPHFSHGIQKRASTVTRVDRGIGLDKIVIGARAKLPKLGTYDAGRYGMTQTKRVSDGYDPITHLQLF